jgi:hypothetical protein
VILKHLVNGKDSAIPALQMRRTIDFTVVTIVSQEAVEALAILDANGTEFRSCPAYAANGFLAKENHD